MKVLLPDLGQALDIVCRRQEPAGLSVDTPGDRGGIFQVAEQLSVRVFEKAALAGQTAYLARQLGMMNQITVPHCAVGDRRNVVDAETAVLLETKAEPGFLYGGAHQQVFGGLGPVVEVVQGFPNNQMAKIIR